MAPLIKCPYKFYKLLTFKWYVSKFEPNRVITLQITVVYEKRLLANFQNNEKILIPCVNKACFLMLRNPVQPKQWLHKCYSDSAPSETTVLE